MNWEQANKNLDERRQKALLGGGQSKIDKQHAGGKLTARERLDLLFDKGTFVETDAFIESRIDDFDLDKRRVPGDGVVTATVMWTEGWYLPPARTLRLSAALSENIIP